MKRLLLLLIPFFIAACPSMHGPGDETDATIPEGVKYKETSFSHLPGWPGENLPSAFSSLQKSCVVLTKRNKWASVCQQAAKLNKQSEKSIQRFFEHSFVPWHLVSGDKHGMVTGYYEPLLTGSLTRTARARYPIYGVPTDLNILDYPTAVRGKSSLVIQRLNGSKRWRVVSDKSAPTPGEAIVRPEEFYVDKQTNVLRGRIVGNRFLPYFKREEIEQGRGINHAEVLAWVEDPVALFFLQVQGSGRIQLDDGCLLRLGYAEKNGYPYISIGKWLVDQKELKLSESSMEGIRGWVKRNPSRQKELFAVNPSYIFFQKLPVSDEGPLGAMGVPLTSGHSIAVDKRFIPLGTTVYLSTTYPSSNRKLQRIVQAQDVGSAINGPKRVDFFWGFGHEAGEMAGKMKQQGDVWLLLPKGVKPISGYNK